MVSELRMLTPRELHDAMGLPPELASDYGKATIKVPLWPPVNDRHRPVAKDVTRHDRFFV